jgi:uncharacterized glyoxalase superfamily protein PhnB
MAAKKKASGKGKGKAKKAAKRTAKKPRKASARTKTTRRTARSGIRSAATRRKVVARRRPESLRLRSAGPSLTANDLQRSLTFYRDVLGFTVSDRWESEGRLVGVELTAGAVQFWLAQDDWRKGRDRIKGQGFRMYCTTSQDIDTLAEQIKARGGTLAEEPRSQPWGGRDFAVVDPDGFTITISSEL